MKEIKGEIDYRFDVYLDEVVERRKFAGSTNEARNELISEKRTYIIHMLELYSKQSDKFETYLILKTLLFIMKYILDL